MNDRCEKIELLFPPLAAAIREISFECNVFPFETFRSPARQIDVYGARTSRARAYESFHQFGLACDLVGGGPARWTWTDVDWEALGKAGKQRGLVWGGDWKIADKAHFQVPTMFSIGQIAAMTLDRGLLGMWLKLIHEGGLR